MSYVQNMPIFLLPSLSHTWLRLENHHVSERCNGLLAGRRRYGPCCRPVADSSSSPDVTGIIRFEIPVPLCCSHKAVHSSVSSVLLASSNASFMGSLRLAVGHKQPDLCAYVQGKRINSFDHSMGGFHSYDLCGKVTTCSRRRHYFMIRRHSVGSRSWRAVQRDGLWSTR